MPPVWLSCLSAWLACFVLFRPFRHYCLSFLFAQLYPHRQLSQWLNIRYESDLTWKTNRRETSIYMPGLAVKAFTWFSGMEVALSADVRKRFVQIQSLYAKDISMERYFGQVVGQTMTMDQFEAFLSDSILLETNRVFRIVDADKEAKLQQDVAVLRTIVNTLVGSPREALTLIVRQFARVRQLSDLLKSVPEHQRLLLFVPQLTLITNFSKMLLKTRGNTEGVEPHFFLEPVSSFFVVETHGYGFVCFFFGLRKTFAQATRVCGPAPGHEQLRHEPCLWTQWIFVSGQHLYDQVHCVDLEFPASARHYRAWRSQVGRRPLPAHCQQKGYHVELPHKGKRIARHVNQ